ncbi:MAG: hypothetical protein NVV82_19975 [Sporocytophaga sp.]|nr:hypothetical protein [Sporocytophaga sp.]
MKIILTCISFLLLTPIGGLKDLRELFKEENVRVYKILAEAQGDLDKDSINEKVVVYDTGEEGDMGTIRNIEIFKLSGKQWKLWHSSSGAVLPSQHGGPMGDPFEGVTVEKGCIAIYHSGGGRYKWFYTHRYRFQKGEWYLIGTTIRYGEPACNLNTFDYNLSTGKIEATIEEWPCEEEAEDEGEDKKEEFSFVVKPAKLPLMDGFYPGDNKVQISKKDKSFYY